MKNYNVDKEQIEKLKNVVIKEAGLTDKSRKAILTYIESVEHIGGMFNTIVTTNLERAVQLAIEYDKKDMVENIPLEFLNDIFARRLFDYDSYLTVTGEWIRELSKWIGNRKCLEIMAGTGRLAKALNSVGVDIVATDSFKWSKQLDYSKSRFDIEELEATEAIEKYGTDVDIIIMSWCYMDEDGYNALKKMREVNPDAIMIYIGESAGGCTGSDSLYEEMVEFSTEETDAINTLYPKWATLHEKVYFIK